MNADLRSRQHLLVKINAKLDPSTRVLTWTFTSLDPSRKNFLKMQE